MVDKGFKSMLAKGRVLGFPVVNVRVVINDGNSQNFYFFINNHLWKWFKAFNADVFSGQSSTRRARCG